MKKLEDIPKNDVFKVPDGYFDKLPGVIQARVAAPDSTPTIRPVFSYALRYALPAVVLFALGIFWFDQRQDAATPESILASIQTEDLITYLNTTEFSTEELLDNVSLDTDDANQIEEAVFGLELDTNAELDELLDQIDLNGI